MCVCVCVGGGGGVNCCLGISVSYFSSKYYFDDVVPLRIAYN